MYLKILLKQNLRKDTSEYIFRYLILKLLKHLVIYGVYLIITKLVVREK